MKIAVINAGSSSIKFQLFDMKNKKVLSHVVIEKIGETSSHVVMKFEDKKEERTTLIKNHYDGLQKIILFLAEYAVLKEFSSLDAIGHRVVHGGEEFCKATLIDDEVVKKIEILAPLAPLHNPANLEGIKVARKQAPHVVQIAVFDTAFHSQMPKEAYMYALKNEIYENYKVRRYGFHGTSYSYILKQSAKFLKKDADKLNIIAFHLGNGSSVCAIQNGISVDTSMGFTPLEGLVMGTRSGDIDAGVIIYMQRELGLSIDEIDNILNKKSGLLGICGKNDVRSIIAQNDEKSNLALNMMIRRIKKYFGAYMALLGRVDAVVFSGGIGENSAYIREKVLENMPFGIELDKSLNSENFTIISTKKSSTKLMVIKTNEELEIANECLEILNK